MSLKDYEVARDKFECDDAFSGYCFPCGACQHRGASSSAEPCLSCDHNANAQPDAGAVRCTWTLKGKVWESACGSQWSYGGRPVHCPRCDRLTAEPGQTDLADAVASWLGVEPVITGADI